MAENGLLKWDRGIVTAVLERKERWKKWFHKDVGHLVGEECYAGVATG